MQHERLRIDRWLWFTRFFKTRSEAAKAVKGGHVRLNGSRADTSSKVKVGDSIDLVRRELSWSLTVTAIPPRRGPASEARACYDEDPESVERREARRESLRADRLAMPRTDGRPDKRTRRKLRDRSRRGGA